MLQDTIPLDSLLVSGFREGREGATEPPSWEEEEEEEGLLTSNE